MSPGIVHLQSNNQTRFYEEMLHTLTRGDRKSLIIVTSSQRISISSKLLQIFSPLYSDIFKDISSRDSDPVTMIVPDFDALTLKHLLALLTLGRIKQNKYLNNFSYGRAFCDLVNLAECLKINIKEKDLCPPVTEHGPVTEVSEKRPTKRNKNLQLMQATGISPPIYPTANNNPSANSYVKVCSTCHKVVSRDKLLFGLHKTQCEREALLLRKKHFTCQKCGDKFATEKSMFQHHVSMHAASSMPLYVCKLCPGFYQTSAKSLRNHITRIHKKVPGRLVYNNSQDSTSYFYETL